MSLRDVLSHLSVRSGHVRVLRINEDATVNLRDPFVLGWPCQISSPKSGKIS